MNLGQIGLINESALSTTGRCLQSCDVFVLAGGLGTRIQSVIGDTPKLLAAIGDRPYFEYLLSWLRSYGARRVILGLGHRAEAIIGYLRDHPALDLDIITVVEPTPLGTAGAIRFARQELRSDPVLVLNGDSFVDANLCQLIERHRMAKSRGTILCTEIDNAEQFGRVVLDPQNYVRGFIEKDQNFHGPGVINAGVYTLSASLLDEIAAGDAASLERDIFERLPAGALAAVSGRFRFIDIGTPDSLANAATVLGVSPAAQWDGKGSAL